MTASAGHRSPLLRVDWGLGGLRESTTATELTETSAFVITESLPPVEAEVDLDLRFGKRPPIRARGRVTQVRLSHEPGAPSGFAVTFVADPPSLDRIASLVRGHDPSEPPSPRVLRVLHVEKNRLLRDMFAYAVNRYFSARGLRVVLEHVASPAEARDAIARGKLDAVVVDCDVEDATGIEVVAYARAHGGPACWLVGIGVGGPESRDRMLASGADIYLRKPLVLRDLLYSMELLFKEEPDDGRGRGAA